MKKDESFISILVPTYNRPILLKKCVQSLFAQNYPEDEYEIIVIDDGSLIEAQKVLKDFDLSSGKLMILRNEGNLGSGASRDIGFDAARGDLIASADDDCCYHKEWLAELSKNLGDYAGVGGSIGLLEEYSFFQKVLAIHSNLGHARIDGDEVVSISGCNALYYRRVILEVGGYSRDRTLAEDRELNLRLTEKGYRLGMVKAAIAYHFPKENIMEYFAWKIRVGDHCHQLVFKHPDSFKSDWLSMMRALPYNPLWLFVFPTNLVRFIFNGITLLPMLSILGSLLALKIMGTPEKILLLPARSSLVGWAVRTRDRQATDLGVIWGEIRRCITVIKDRIS